MQIIYFNDFLQESDGPDENLCKCIRDVENNGIMRMLKLTAAKVWAKLSCIKHIQNKIPLQIRYGQDAEISDLVPSPSSEKSNWFFVPRLKPYEQYYARAQRYPNTNLVRQGLN